MTDDTTETVAATKRFKMLRLLGKLTVYTVIVFTATFLMETFLVRSYFIPSESMAATLQTTDHILAEQVTPKIDNIQRGDIIIFEDPDGWLPESYKSLQQPNFIDYLFNPIHDMMGIQRQNEESNLIKRVIGLPGDTVECCSSTGHVIVNGVEITEPYVITPEEAEDASGVEFKVTVPEGYVWVMGDNRYNSSDSRYHQEDKNGGFIPMANIKGKAVMITYPFNRITILGSYPQVFAGVPKS